MTAANRTEIARQAAANREALAANPYPGRGIVLGRSEDGESWLQLYWIMGRSANSRNRRLVAEGVRLRTEPLDPAAMEHPELVIYTAMDEHAGMAVVTNGDHTGSVIEALRAGRDYRDALGAREREPDAPNYTPRIAGGIDGGGIDGGGGTAWLAILKADPGDPARTVRAYYQYEALEPGFGWCLTTYAGDGNPLPPYEGAPRPFPLPGAPENLAEAVWGLLNRSNRVALALKIMRSGAESSLTVINAYPKAP
ncbi:MAG: inosine monophosphate cyclohydrolase [SAR324 cluster bacterium]|nr:inosine monophosphate cyclohydrolase [SAR324 cluster bacterium]